MRIAQTATLFAEDSAYGGPMTVALEQCKELSARGHDVTLYTGWDGKAEIPSGLKFDVVTARARTLIPGGGVSGLISAPMVRRLHRDAPMFDVVHIHFGRDLIALSAATVVGRTTPFVLQTHGMVMPDARLRARVLDTVTVRRSLQSAAAVLCLTDREQTGLSMVSGDRAVLVHLSNGVGDVAGSAPRHVGAKPPTVLFCARLHRRKRPQAFVEMSEVMQRQGVECKYRVAGPDEGELSALVEHIRRARSGGVDIEYIGSLTGEAARAALAQSDVFVLPSDDEPFPMTVLEAMSLGTPAVVTDSCGLAPLLRKEKAAVVSDRDPHSLADAVTQLVTDDSWWLKTSRLGQALVAGELSAGAVVDRLENVYERAVARSA